MHIENRYDALIEKHRRIEARLTAELKRPLPDMFSVQRLKREKLLVKDEIESWERLMSAIRVQPVLRSPALHS